MKTILVLEYEPLVMKLLRHVLRQYQVVSSAAAEQVLQVFGTCLRRSSGYRCEAANAIGNPSSAPLSFAGSYTSCCTHVRLSCGRVA